MLLLQQKIVKIVIAFDFGHKLIYRENSRSRNLIGLEMLQHGCKPITGSRVLLVFIRVSVHIMIIINDDDDDDDSDDDNGDDDDDSDNDDDDDNDDEDDNDEDDNDDEDDKND